MRCQFFFSSFKKEDLSYIDPSGRNLLSNAIIEELPSVINFLIQFDEVINQGDERGLTPLHFCALRNDVKTADLLLKKGILIDTQDDFGNTPISKAIFRSKNNNYEIISFLVKNGAKVELENNYGVSAIDLAKGKGDKRLFSILCPNNSKHNFFDNKNK